MGAIFGSSSPPPMPAMPEPPDPDEEERKRRIEAMERNRRGRRGTIVTSERGLLEPADWVPKRKTLLGE